MKNVHMCYIRVTEGKIENLKKEGKMRLSTLIFIYTIHFAYLKVYTKFQNPKSSILKDFRNAPVVYSMSLPHG